MSRPPLSALRAFEAVARHRSVSRAGDELHVTHAAVSHQLKNLETWCGAELVARTGRGILLTPIGEELSSILAPAFRQIEHAGERLLQLTKQGQLTVGCIPSIASRWLIPHLPVFHSARPDAEIRVVYAQPQERLTASTLDVLITHSNKTEAGTRADPLFSRISKPVCSRGFLEKWGPADPHDWYGKVPLLHDENHTDWRTWLEQAGGPVAASGGGTVFQDFNLLATAAIAGHGVALCPVEVFRHEIAAGDLVVLSDLSIKAEDTYTVRLRADAKPLAEAFATWFLEAVGKSPGPVSPKGLPETPVKK